MKNYKELDNFLQKYNWVLESHSPLNIKSANGEHFAQNFAAEVMIQYLENIDQTNDPDEIDNIRRAFL